VTGQFFEPDVETLSALVAFSDPAAGTSSAMFFAAAEDLFAFAFETHSAERRYR